MKFILPVYKIIALLQNDDSIRIVTTPAGNSSRVEFFSASIDDNGEYECIVSNVAGSVRHSFSIELMQGKSEFHAETFVRGKGCGTFMYIAPIKHDILFAAFR